MVDNLRGTLEFHLGSEVAPLLRQQSAIDSDDIGACQPMAAQNAIEVGDKTADLILSHGCRACGGGAANVASADQSAAVPGNDEVRLPPLLPGAPGVDREPQALAKRQRPRHQIERLRGEEQRIDRRAHLSLQPVSYPRAGGIDDDSSADLEFLACQLVARGNAGGGQRASQEPFGANVVGRVGACTDCGGDDRDEQPLRIGAHGVIPTRSAVARGLSRAAENCPGQLLRPDMPGRQSAAVDDTAIAVEADQVVDP